VLACDFLTVETAFLERIYVLFFISLATRRIEYVACTPNPDGSWVAQQARNLIMRFGDQQPFRFLVHDRDTKFSHAFDEVFRTEGIRVIRTPVQAPNANAVGFENSVMCVSGGYAAALYSLTRPPSNACLWIRGAGRRTGAAGCSSGGLSERERCGLCRL
jgi:hypothetical protein